MRAPFVNRDHLGKKCAEIRSFNNAEGKNVFTFSKILDRNLDNGPARLFIHGEIGIKDADEIGFD